MTRDCNTRASGKHLFNFSLLYLLFIVVTFIFTFFVYVFTNNNGLALHRRYNVEIYNLEVLKWQKTDGKTAAFKFDNSIEK